MEKFNGNLMSVNGSPINSKDVGKFDGNLSSITGAPIPAKDIAGSGGGTPIKSETALVFIENLSGVLTFASPSDLNWDNVYGFKVTTPLGAYHVLYEHLAGYIFSRNLTGQRDVMVRVRPIEGNPLQHDFRVSSRISGTVDAMVIEEPTAITALYYK